MYTANMQKSMEVKSDSDLLGLELQMFVSHLWALGTELRSSAKAVSTFNRGVISHACVHVCGVHYCIVCLPDCLCLCLNECRHK